MTGTNKMSKRRMLKIQKIRANANLDEAQKERMIETIHDEAQEYGRKVKRSKLDDYKAEDFIQPERIVTTENIKANTSSLWNDGEKAYLEDVTMNLVPDDDAVKNLKGQTAMRWDAKKKRYMLKKVDREGRVIAEKRNESGAKITNKMKEKGKESIFKKWQQRTHLTLQKSGEMEDTNAIA